MNRIALGTVQFGLPYGIANTQGQVAQTAISDILDVARAGGIDTIDTAIAYGNAEARLGCAGVADLAVVTKLPALPEGCEDARAWVGAQLSHALERLGTARLHGLMLHRPDQLLGPHGAALYAGLKDAQMQDKTTRIGVSIYDPATLGPLLASYDLDIVQAPFNIVDQRFARTGWLSRLRDAGVEIHCRSAFLQGLLLMPRAAIPAQFSRWSPLWDRWCDWLAAQPMSGVEAALGFALSRPEITRVVVGVDHVDQLRDILRVARTCVRCDWPDMASDDANLIDPSRWETP